MENIVYRLSDDKWKSLMVSSGFVHLSTKSHDTALSFHGSIEKKGLLERLDKIPVAGITRMSLLPVEEEVKLFWLDEEGKELEFTAGFNAERDARAVAEGLAGLRNLTLHERAAGKWRSMKTPGFGLLISIACTVITYGIAQDLAAGQDLTPTGRRAWLKLIFNGIAGLLGTTGTLVVGGGISLLFAYWTYKRLNSPSTELVWR